MSEDETKVGVKETLIEALDDAATDNGGTSDTGDAIPVRVDSVELEKTTPVSVGGDADDTSKPVSAPPVTPPSAQVSAPSPKPAATTPGVFVLQWLSYAFWVWFGVSLGWLSGVVVAYFVTGSHSSDWGVTLAYPLAAVIVMLIISLVTDFFYSKHEQAQKSGGSMVIMMLHAVPMVLVAIGALITAVFAIILMLLNNDPVSGINGPKITMIVSFVMALTYGAMAYRIVFGGKRTILRPIYWGIVGALAVGFIIAGFAGPGAEAARTKQDRLIESALPSLSDDIRAYASKNDKLPQSLKDVTHSGSDDAKAAQQIIDQGLVTYKPNTLPAEDGNTYSPSDDTSGVGVTPMATSSSATSAAKPVDYNYNGAKRFYYQLCTKYTAEKKSQYAYDTPSNYYTTNASSVGVSADYRTSSIYSGSISSHPAGDVCYNLYADGKGSYNYTY